MVLQKKSTRCWKDIHANSKEFHFLEIWKELLIMKHMFDMNFWQTLKYRSRKVMIDADCVAFFVLKRNENVWRKATFMKLMSCWGVFPQKTKPRHLTEKIMWQTLWRNLAFFWLSFHFSIFLPWWFVQMRTGCVSVKVSILVGLERSGDCLSFPTVVSLWWC